jgi:single-strand DNA-binding protein
MTDEKTMAAEPLNQVLLIGRVSRAPELRALPSGDELVLCRVVVPRPAGRSSPRQRGRQTVDVVECVGWTARARRAMARWSAGDEVRVEGALRRRFFRAGGRVSSRTEVEVSSARLVRRGDG